jgi:hypothetical protein
MFVILVIVILIVVAILFGGFQKGTKSGSLAPAFPSITTAQITG